MDIGGGFKKVAILQSNYIPWKGYFDLIRQVDLFIFYDDVQYTKNDWRNRNRIVTPRGGEWLTIPCGPDIHRRIDQVRVDNRPWQRSHWDKIRESYREAPFWGRYHELFSDVLLGKTWEYLSDINKTLIELVCREILNIQTPFADSTRFHAAGEKTERLISLLTAVGATHYLSGPSARDYIDPAQFAGNGIELEYIHYDGYPVYRQLHGRPFRHDVSIIDLIFNTGPEASRHLERPGD